MRHLRLSPPHEDRPAEARRGVPGSEQGLTELVTPHNLALGYEADRGITLEDGRIVKEEQGRKAWSAA